MAFRPIIANRLDLKYLYVSDGVFQWIRLWRFTENLWRCWNLPVAWRFPAKYQTLLERPCPAVTRWSRGLSPNDIGLGGHNLSVGGKFRWLAFGVEL